ncbi:MAG: tetratricopeptide repeat protein, partial [Myxococcales bacterium]|nr:tetratricopeptide repeat protein [Myxococcales bacterium]
AVLVELVGVHTALAHYDTAAAIAEIAGPQLDPKRQPLRAAELQLRLASLYHNQQRWDQAIAANEAGIAILREAFGDDHPRIAALEMQLGNSYSESGRDLERARELYRSAIEHIKTAYGDHHPLLASAQINLGGIHYRRGEVADTVALLESAAELYADIYPPNHPSLGIVEQNLGATLQLLGRYDEAVEHTRASLRIIEARLGKEHPSYAGAERNLANTLVLLGRSREAQPYLEHAATVYATSLEPGDTRQLSLATQRAEVAWWLGDTEQFAEQIAIISAALPTLEAEDSRRTAALDMMVLARLDAGEATQALAFAEELLQFMLESAGEHHPDTLRARVHVARALRELRRFDDAEVHLEAALAGLAGPEGTDSQERPHPEGWRLHLERGELAMARGDRKAAAAGLAAALEQTTGALQRALLELGLARALIDDEPTRARDLARSAAAVIREDAPRPELLGALAEVLDE